MGGFSLLVTFIVAASLADIASTFCDEFCATHRTFVYRLVCMLRAVLYSLQLWFSHIFTILSRKLFQKV